MKKRISLILITSYTFLGTSYTPVSKPTSSQITPANTFFISPAALFGIKTVVIDAGHGGKDPGCLGITTSQEKHIALAIALKLGKYIQKNTPDVKVIYTRSSDIFIDLDERAAIANRNKADLFICIHCNTACSINKKTKKKSCNEEVFGTETYVMGLHKTNANLNVAKRENEAILLEKNYQKRYDGFDPNSETGYILLTMQQSAYLKQSLSFASKVQKHVKEKSGRIDKGVQQAGFLVLWRTSMPSVLIETEFISNTESEKFALSEAGQDNLAHAIFSAFRQYKDEIEGKYMKYDDETGVSEQNTPAPILPVKDVKENKNNKDSISLKAAPIIVDETKLEKTSEDSALVKNGVLPPLKEKMEIENRKLETKEKKDSIIKNDTINKKPILDKQSQEQIFYKVQFMSSGRRIPLLSDKFKGLKDVGEYEDSGSYKYTAGEFKTIEEAMKYRTEMLNKNHKGCFVVKFKDGKRLKNN
jgi:N-acetylmuramoyl-L-alanine amidase